MSALRSIFLRREAGILVMIVLFCLAVGSVKPQFLTLDSLRIILLLVPLIMFCAMGQMLVIVARHVDLSIGSILGLTAMASGMMFRFQPDIWWPVVQHSACSTGCWSRFSDCPPLSSHWAHSIFIVD
jgi:rhamnose transport system permease protein